MNFTADDILVIPEGHTDIMASTVFLPCRRVIIALNWANIFASLPVGLDWNSFQISGAIAGSEYEQTFIRETMGLDSTVIVSGIDSAMFKPSATKLCQIAFMPRKNARVFHLIASAFRSMFPEFSEVPFVPVDGVSHGQVAHVLAESAVFLATSFPEGLARPPLEAMASGCSVVGFAGRGSLEYMEHRKNCYLAADMDVLNAAQLLGAALRDFKEGTASVMQKAGRETALRYSLEREEETVVTYWGEFLRSAPLVASCPRIHPHVTMGESPDALDRCLGFEDLYDRIVAKAPDDANVVEIGSGLGTSTVYLAQNVRASAKGIHIYAVDNFSASQPLPRLVPSVSRQGGSVFHAFCENIRAHGLESLVTPVLGDPSLSASRFPDHSVDFVFVNGHYGSAKIRSDILAWVPKLKPGGGIGGCHYDENHLGVIQAVGELFPSGRYEIIQCCWLVENPHSSTLALGNESYLGSHTHTQNTLRSC